MRVREGKGGKEREREGGKKRRKGERKRRDGKREGRGGEREMERWRKRGRDRGMEGDGKRACI